jgi:hypothetical protein
MVSEENIIDHIVLRYRLGTILLWLGVLTWAPFIFLRAIGEKPQFLWFLPFHLVGVIGGSRLRAAASKELGMPPGKKNLLRVAGHVLIFLGILAWAPYLYLKVVIGQPMEFTSVLPFHLTGVLGGVSLHVLSYLIDRQRKSPR